MSSLVIDRTRFVYGLTDWPTDRWTDMCKAIYPLFFYGGHNNTKNKPGCLTADVFGWCGVEMWDGSVATVPGNSKETFFPVDDGWEVGLEGVSWKYEYINWYTVQVHIYSCQKVCEFAIQDVSHVEMFTNHWNGVYWLKRCLVVYEKNTLLEIFLNFLYSQTSQTIPHR